MKTIEIMAEAIHIYWIVYGFDTSEINIELAKAALQSIHEPDPAIVAIVADRLNMDAIKVAAVWMLMVEESLK